MIIVRQKAFTFDQELVDKVEELIKNNKGKVFTKKELSEIFQTTGISKLLAKHQHTGGAGFPGIENLGYTLWDSDKISTEELQNIINYNKEHRKSLDPELRLKKLLDRERRDRDLLDEPSSDLISSRNSWNNNPSDELVNVSSGVPKSKAELFLSSEGGNLSEKDRFNKREGHSIFGLQVHPNTKHGPEDFVNREQYYAKDRSGYMFSNPVRLKFQAPSKFIYINGANDYESFIPNDSEIIKSLKHVRVEDLNTGEKYGLFRGKRLNLNAIKELKRIKK